MMWQVVCVVSWTHTGYVVIIKVYQILVYDIAGDKMAGSSLEVPIFGTIQYILTAHFCILDPHIVIPILYWIPK